ncbi:MAG: hypothetical protein RJB68_2109 [Pseudomonadota bacterium]|jgi:hypothetical protein
MNGKARTLLLWIRNDPHTASYADGVTYGFLIAVWDQLEPWEAAYVENVLNARRKGIPA